MHHYLVGKTGMGKSSLLKNLILSDDGGWAYIDPHGQDAEDIADTTDCIYWEPYDLSRTVGFNPLKDISKGQRHLAAANVVACLRAIWSESWGPRMEYILLHSVRVLVEHNQSLLDISRLLTDTRYRTRLLSSMSDTAFWQNEFEKWDERYRNDAIAPVLNKVGQFALDPVLSAVLRDSTIDLRRVMDKGQRLVVNLSKGKLGAIPAHLLGALIVSSFSQAAHARADTPEQERAPFTLYVDEFQNFATDSFADILSEARKYRLELVLAHQYLGQLPEALRQAVFGNVSRFTVFKVGPEDAAVLAREMDLAPQTLMDLGPYETWTKNGHRSFEKTSPPPGRRGRLAAVRARTKARYARARGV